MSIVIKVIKIVMKARQVSRVVDCRNPKVPGSNPRGCKGKNLKNFQTGSANKNPLTPELKT